ncbi:MAG: hypothetical protein RL758_1465 [Pseudomonadota bacterium]|jgi:hypothetical protein
MPGAVTWKQMHWPLALTLAGALLLSGCSHRPAPSPEASAWATASLLGQTPMWEHRTFKNRAPTHYHGTQHQGRPALHANSRSGSSLMRHRLQWPGDRIGTLHFSWFIDALQPAFDLTDRDAEDAVARVILTFDGDRSRLSARDRALSELALLVTGEPLPYATLMYVWDHEHPEGTVLKHPATSRIRMLVVRSGAEGLGRWQDIDRDVRADFEHVFGEAPVMLTGLGLMTDANNTGLTAQAWFGPVRLGTVVAAEP